jgi:hypothetical protein
MWLFYSRYVLHDIKIQEQSAQSKAYFLHQLRQRRTQITTTQILVNISVGTGAGIKTYTYINEVAFP